MSRRETVNRYYEVLLKAAQEDNCVKEVMAELGKKDRWFLMLYVLDRWDADRDFIFERCREVEANENGYIDLWSREHYKSTIITILGTLQGLINDVEKRHLILSFNRPIAKSFLRVIKLNCEMNDLFPALWPEVFWDKPKQQAPKWSEDDGLIFKCKSQRNTNNIEAWGLIDGQPTSKHADVVIYNDIQTDKNDSPQMIRKTIDAWELSTNLGTEGGARRYEGTFYAHHDVNMEVIQRGAAIPRIYPATDDGTIYGNPVLWSRAEWEKRLREQSPMSVACQLLLDPKQGGQAGFELQWIKYWTVKDIDKLKRIILVDPAKKREAIHDYCVFWVIGLGADRNWYVIDIVRDKLDLGMKTKKLFELHHRYEPHHVFYEEYGMQSDIEHFNEIMDRENYRFDIEPMGGPVKKPERVEWLYPVFRESKIYFPNRPIVYQSWDGEVNDMMTVFIQEEYVPYPFGQHDDMMDCLSRIKDPALLILPPEPYDNFGLPVDKFLEHDEAAFDPFA